MSDSTLYIRQLGLEEYLPVWQRMQAYTDTRDEHSKDEIWLVQHPPVFTLGRNGKPEHLLNLGDIPLVKVDRGGQVTYHGPGQIVAYLMLDLRRLGKGIREVVSSIERAIINQLALHEIHAQARADAPGVYVDDAKIAALGLRVRHGKCYHGLSFNIDMDMEPFSRINPCGYQGMAVTQLSDLIAADIQIDRTEKELIIQLASQLDYKNIDWITSD
ncbi:MAG: lipoyl(octanoyl) transferase LipB [Gammaproteobacteria bacterium]|nr:lipoyl(octanoyl) transferase LipB [Gammaproteobacteria bacterium]